MDARFLFAKFKNIYIVTVGDRENPQYNWRASIYKKSNSNYLYCTLPISELESEFGNNIYEMYQKRWE